METGSNFNPPDFFIDPSLDQDKVKECRAVISINSKSLGLAVFNHTGNKILALGSAEWEERESGENFPDQFNSFTSHIGFSIEECLSQQWVWSGGNVTLIPQHLYSEENERDLLNLTNDNKQGGLIEKNIWPEHKVICLYRFPQHLKMWLQEKTPHAGIIHSATALKNLYNYYTPEKVFAFLMVDERKAEFFLAGNGKLLFYNNFRYEVEEDLLYYLLFALEQNGILAPELSLKVGGNIHKEQRLWMLLEDYIGKVEIPELPENFHLSDGLNKYTVYRQLNLMGGL